MKDRFDLENEIVALHSFADQLSTVSEGIMEARLTTDDTVNVLLKLHADKLFDTMSQCFKLDGYRDE